MGLPSPPLLEDTLELAGMSPTLPELSTWPRGPLRPRPSPRLTLSTPPMAMVCPTPDTLATPATLTPTPPTTTVPTAPTTTAWAPPLLPPPPLLLLLLSPLLR